MRRSLLTAIIPLAFLLSGCDPEPEQAVSETFGYKPVYGSAESAAIVMTSAMPVADPGKIYEYGKYLFVNEVNKGIHVFDNSSPATPTPVGFIRILGNTEMAIRNNVLYANHLGNIVAVDLKDLTSVEQLASLPLQSTNGGALPPKGYYFECIEPEKGIVLNWVMVERKNMDCYALR